jgi:hypothetical protein
MYLINDIGLGDELQKCGLHTHIPPNNLENGSLVKEI